MLPSAHRLTGAGAFSAAQAGSFKTRSRDFVVYLSPADPPVGPVRVGLVVGKAVGNSVVRSRVQRRLRHQLRPWVDRLSAGSTVVVRANPGAAGLSSAEIRRGLEESLSRCLEQALRKPGQGVTP